MAAPPTWPVAAGALVAGFAVAQATGVRPLGGLVLLAGAAWCAVRWRRAAGTATTLLLLAVFAGAFAASHAIAAPLGTWPAVLLVAGVTGAAAWALADRARALRPRARPPRPRRPRRPGAAGDPAAPPARR